MTAALVGWRPRTGVAIGASRIPALPRVRPTTAVGLAALAAGAVVRLADLGHVGFGSDEAVYAGQAAGLSGAPMSASLPTVRTHPMLFHALLAPLVSAGASDATLRAVPALMGLATAVVAFALGRQLWGDAAGWLGAALVATMPYHVIVSRQVLLDAPAVFVTSVAVLVAVRSRAARRTVPAAAVAGAVLGLAVLTKETAVLALPAVAVALLAERPRVRHARIAVAAAVSMVAVVATYPVLLALTGQLEDARASAGWQLDRGTTGSLGLYGRDVLPLFGPVLAALAVAGVVAAVTRRLDWRGRLLATWFAVPAAFFLCWPVRGFAYLTATVVPAALLAAGAIVAAHRRLARPAVVALLVAVVGGQLVAAAAARSLPAVPAAGGLTGGREAATWLADHAASTDSVVTPEWATANVVAYYSHLRVTAAGSASTAAVNPAYRGRTTTAPRWWVWDAVAAAGDPAAATAFLDRVHRSAAHVADVELGPGGVPVAVVWSAGR